MLQAVFSSRNEPPPIGRGGWLDALRFIVAALIILHHFQMSAPVPLAEGLHPVFERGGFLLTNFFLIDSAGRPRQQQEHDDPRRQSQAGQDVGDGFVGRGHDVFRCNTPGVPRFAARGEGGVSPAARTVPAPSAWTECPARCRSADR